MEIIGRSPQGVEIAAWVLKGDPNTYDVDAELETNGVIELWSVHENYRTELMGKGQRCLLWRSGPSGAFIAAGYITGEVFPSNADPDEWVDKDRAKTADLFVSVRLLPLHDEISRAELKDHPVLSQAEVLRVRQGSNPSILTPEELEALEELLADVDPSNPPWFAAVSAGAEQLYVPRGTPPDAEEGTFALVKFSENDDLVEIGRYDGRRAAVLAAADVLSGEIGALPPSDLEGDAVPVFEVFFDRGEGVRIFKVAQGFQGVLTGGVEAELIADDPILANVLTSILSD